MTDLEGAGEQLEAKLAASGEDKALAKTIDVAAIALKDISRGFVHPNITYGHIHMARTGGVGRVGDSDSADCRF